MQGVINHLESKLRYSRRRLDELKEEFSSTEIEHPDQNFLEFMIPQLEQAIEVLKSHSKKN